MPSTTISSMLIVLIAPTKTHISMFLFKLPPLCHKLHSAYRWKFGFHLLQISDPISSLQFAGCRKHASLVANDKVVSMVFARECYISEEPHRWCISDEHYVPTLLATLGKLSTSQGFRTYTQFSLDHEVYNPTLMLLT